ncbi:DUF4333 domain-containing protein [Mycobacterium sp. SMC-16]|uniref:DUF4333 domain-containing protein n=1 Tax=Mycolicibacterium mucogenicum TaxID=56689 RepID=A0A1A0N6A7_MYCMU|nr:DUF4333 domain-containing protein [Mycolicibacterium mucogenicum]MCX8558815.1 DUF4333 domain-containing protein [Mycolicibacterium mucogenicum]OBA92573.1 hypothetical protein A5642_09105 [Mycolicibacterium mucogenicum]
MAGRSTPRWAALLTAACLLTSCSVHVGGGVTTMSKGQLETAVKDKLSTKTTSTIDSVVCDGGLEGKVGAAQTCTVVTGAKSRRATVRAVDVKGSNIALSIEIIPGQ